MSRIARVPVTIPSGVTVTTEGNRLIVKGSKGELQTHIPSAQVKLTPGDGIVTVTASSDTQESRAASGLVRTLTDKLVRGVTEPFTKALEFSGVGYRAVVEGQQLKLSLGYSHPIVMEIPAGITVEVKKQIITVTGSDAQAIGQFAANVRAHRVPEPYKGKGIHYVGEHVRRKAGKTGKAAE